MPRYKKDMDRIIEKEDADICIGRAKNEQQRVLVALLYLIGPRPAEAATLKGKRFTIAEDKIMVNIRTLKITETGRELYDTRTLPIGINCPYVKDIIIPYVAKIGPEKYLFSFRTPERVKQIVYKVSHNTLTPYSFRHSRLMKLSMAGATTQQLMAWKGAKSEDSVRPYVQHGAVLGTFTDRID